MTLLVGAAACLLTALSQPVNRVLTDEQEIFIETLASQLAPGDFPCYLRARRVVSIAPSARLDPNGPIAKYVAITQLYREKLPNSLKLKTQEEDLTWDVESLMRVLYRAYKLEQEHDTKEYAVVESVDKEEFAFGKNGGKLQVIRLKSYERLGHGGESTIERVLHVSQGQFAAMKSMNEIDPHFCNILLTETRILAELHKDGVLPCVVASPLLTVATSTHQFWVGRLYQGDVASCLGKVSCTVEERIAFCGQLIGIMVELHKRNAAHRDFKLQNILMNGSTLLLADFGRSVTNTVQNPNKDEELIPTPFTFTNQDKFEYHRTLSDYEGTAVRVFQKQDVFALGIALYNLLFLKDFTDKRMVLPYLFDSVRVFYRIPLRTAPEYEALRKEEEFSELLKLLGEMLAPDPFMRSTIDAVESTWSILNFQKIAKGLTKYLANIAVG